MADTLKPGDVVILKSGGPTMTVENVAKRSSGGDQLHAWCVWFIKDKQERGVYPLEALELAD